MSLKIVVITGQSGSGKSTALRALEDRGYLCIDNVPVSLVDALVRTIDSDESYGRLALGMDARDPGRLQDAPEYLTRLREGPHSIRVMYLESREEVLIRRFSETRRRHPIDSGEGLLAALARERKLLANLRELADECVDTSALSPHELRRRIVAYVTGETFSGPMRVALLSFGFRYGVPLDADMVFDARFLPNPYFVQELRERTGLEQKVRDYVLKTDLGREFLSRSLDYLSFLLPEFKKEAKSYLTIAVGCTGGRHRSVSIAWALAEKLQGAGYRIDLHHRDVGEQQS